MMSKHILLFVNNAILKDESFRGVFIYGEGLSANKIFVRTHQNLADELSSQHRYLDSAKKRLDEAGLLSQQINRKRTRLTVLHVSGNLAAIMGDYDQARTNLQEAFILGEELGERMESHWCRAKLGGLVINQGNLVEARQLLVQSTKEFQADGTVVGVVFTLERLASLYVTKPELAIRLVGWADAAHLQISDPRPSIEQADVDKIIAACIAKMGEVAFSDAYDEGQKMTMDEAVALALGTN